MMYKSYKSKLDQYLPAMLLAVGIKDTYGGHMPPLEMASQIHNLMFAGTPKANTDAAFPTGGQGSFSPKLLAQDDALFAACAFIDEALMTSQWGERDKWPSHSLVRHYFDTVKGGTEFFDRLNCLLQEQRKVQSSEGLVTNIVKSYENNGTHKVCTSSCDHQNNILEKHEKKDVGNNSSLWNIKNASSVSDDACNQADRDMASSHLPRFLDPWQESLEVFSAALTLGFTGCHYGSAEGTFLESIKEDVALALGLPHVDAAGKWPSLAALGKSKPTIKYAEYLMTLLQFGIPLLLVLFFLMLQREMLVSFTLDWAKALGVLT